MVMFNVIIVLFWMLKNKSNSKYLVQKLKYNDFECSIQI